MRTIELVKGIRSSALGFGCAPILGAVDARQARRALDCAFEYGITHYDLARSYGYGDAESFVGRVIKGRRDQLILASKFGIRANWKSHLFKHLKPLVRKIRSSTEKKGLISEKRSPLIRTAADILHNRVPFRADEMRRSLEESLRALKTDYLDYFFLHEPTENILCIDELMVTAQLLKEEGKIRAWGIAYSRLQEPIHSAYLDKFDILQFDNSFGASGYNTTVAERGLKHNILFSPLRGGIPTLPPTEKLRKLFQDFPNSTVLCSMFDEMHIQSNARLVE